MDVLHELDRPTRVTVIAPILEPFKPIYDEVDRVLAQMKEVQPLLREHRLDPVAEPGRVDELARVLALSPRDLSEAGAVVFEQGGRREAIDLIDLAQLAPDALGAGAAQTIFAERAMSQALAHLVYGQPATICFTTGHGELVPRIADAEVHLGHVAARLSQLGMIIRELDRVGQSVPDACRVLVVAGQKARLSDDEALAVSEYLQGGGALFLAVDAGDGVLHASPSLQVTGLELVLADYGLALPPAIVLDPEHEIDLPLAWVSADGYAEHPVTESFRGRRLSVWYRPRAVALSKTQPPHRSAELVVVASPKGWGETDLKTLFSGGDVAAGPGDQLGVVGVAAAAHDGKTGARVVVMGSAESLSSALTDRGLGAGDALAAAAIGWLAGREQHVKVGNKTPERVRLIMTDGQLRATFALAVVAIPLLVAGLGVVSFFVRRRG